MTLSRRERQSNRSCPLRISNARLQGLCVAACLPPPPPTPMHTLPLLPGTRQGRTHPLCRLRLQLAELLAQVAALVRELEHLPAERVLLRQALGNLHLGGVSGRVGLRAGTQGAGA